MAHSVTSSHLSLQATSRPATTSDSANRATSNANVHTSSTAGNKTPAAAAQRESILPQPQLVPSQTSSIPSTSSRWARSGGGGIGGTAEDLASSLASCTDAELVQILEELTKKNENLELENKMFASFLGRVGNQGGGDGKKTADELANNGIVGGQTMAGDATQTSSQGAASQATPQVGRRAAKKGGGTKTKEAHAQPVALTPDQKAEIATRELEEQRDEMERKKTEWERIQDSLKAEMEELEVRQMEYKKLTYEFQRDVVVGGVNERTGKVIAEKVVRDYEDRLRAQDTLVTKLRLKSSTLRTTLHKLRTQLHQKEEMGEVLHAIDFDQLQIENRQYVAKIEERNAEVVALKVVAGRGVGILNHYKQSLASLTTTCARLRADITSRTELLSKLRAEHAAVKDELERQNRVRQELEDMGKGCKVPEVIEYVDLKVLYSLERTSFKPKRECIDIAEASLLAARKVWRAVQVERGVVPPKKAMADGRAKQFMVASDKGEGINT
ncbi:hypothetical protein HDU93_008438 [Gonapodya sp. JEL0774]|nr:hypothetical protein HDU93_008438 [Gonapodya sp. JEL0774]